MIGEESSATSMADVEPVAAIPSGSKNRREQANSQGSYTGGGSCGLPVQVAYLNRSNIPTMCPQTDSTNERNHRFNSDGGNSEDPFCSA